AYVDADDQDVDVHLFPALENLRRLVRARDAAWIHRTRVAGGGPATGDGSGTAVDVLCDPVLSPDLHPHVSAVHGAAAGEVGTGGATYSAEGRRGSRQPGEVAFSSRRESRSAPARPRLESLSRGVLANGNAAAGRHE